MNNDPDRIKAIPLMIRYSEAVAVLEIDEWSVLMNLLTAFQGSDELDRDDKYFLEGIKTKIVAWVNNSGFGDFPEGYLE